MPQSDPDADELLEAARERLRDLARPESVGSHITPEDQAAFRAILADYEEKT